MSTISFSGLATGIDTASIISQLVALERRPETLLKNQQTTNTTKISDLQKIEDYLSTLQNVVKGFNSPATFAAAKASVLDSSVLSATTAAGATPGTHTVEVISLAHNQRQVSDGVASATSKIFSTGSFTINNGSGTTTTVNIAEGQNTLQGIASAINSSGANVSASVINDGTNYRLVVNGNDTKNYAFDFSGLSTDPVGGTGPLVPNLPQAGPTYQAGTDATFKVDGVSMTKQSNTVTDAIQGVTLNLAKEGSSTNITVTTDTDSITTKLNNFVTAYNNVINFINSESTYNPTSKTAGILSGDSTVRGIKQQLQALLTSPVVGASGTFNSLASIGIKSDSKTGTLSLDSAKLSSNLTNHYNDVVDYFAHNGGTAATTLARNKYGIAQQFNLVIETMVHAFTADGVASNGTLEIAKRTLTLKNKQLDDAIATQEDRITALQANLQAQYAAMENTVSNLKSQGNLITSFFASNSSSSSSSSSNG